MLYDDKGRSSSSSVPSKNNCCSKTEYLHKVTVGQCEQAIRRHIPFRTLHDKLDALGAVGRQDCDESRLVIDLDSDSYAIEHANGQVNNRVVMDAAGAHGLLMVELLSPVKESQLVGGYPEWSM
jgi:hypothetical protein